MAEVNQLELQDIADSYVGMFRFPQEYKDHFDQTGSVSNSPKMECWTDFIPVDIDRKDDLAGALIDAKELIGHIEERGVDIIEQLPVYFSGYKGFHIEIPTILADLKPSVDLPLKIKAIALKLAGDIPIDTSIYERNRLWRVPNTINSKSGLYKIPISLEDLEKGIDYIRERAKFPQGPPYLPVPIYSKLQPCQSLVKLAKSVESELTTGKGHMSSGRELNQSGWIARALMGLYEGNRNSTFTKIAGRLHSDGWQSEDIKQLLYPHAEQVRFPQKELETVVKSVSRYPQPIRFSDSSPIYGPESENPKTGSELVVPLDVLLEEEDEKIDWILDGIFPAQGVGIIAGDPGVGKSWMLLDLAFSCAFGEKWLGHFETLKCSVLYIDEESWRKMLRDRCRKLRNERNHARPCHINFVIGCGINLSYRVGADLLRQIVSDTRPKLIIIDSLTRVHSADENSASEIAKIFGIVRQISRDFDCFVLFADHNRKPGDKPASDIAKLRGSIDKSASIDSLLSISKKNDLLCVRHAKSRMDQPIKSFRFFLDDLISRSLKSVSFETESSDKPPSSNDAALTLIKKTLGNGSSIGRLELLELARKSGINRSAIDNAIRQLKADKKIAKETVSGGNGRGGQKAVFRLVQGGDNQVESQQ